MNWWLVAIGWYAVASVVTFAAFGIDKRAATRQRRRTPERRLHALELLGGWPGALLGQRVFHHKSRKRTYRAVLRAIIAIHVAAWATVAWLVWR